ncbi:hypothetical protein EGW08_003915 [Elysia chlorotica]|uniref:Uncharacterized protein n=1 Tax=Elysia chlorotica TaxID=188477 RepID=A0A3S1BPE9_ELYCH|nr:hypothetical protein EGW08_003915 [Elysia chlorotica]
MFPIPRAKIGGPSVAAHYGDDDVSDRGLDDISLREDDLHSVNLGSEAMPGSRPAWMTMLDKPDFQKLHLDPFAKKGSPSVKSSMYGTKASTFSPMYDARHMFQTHASLASYSVDGDLKQPWDMFTLLRYQRVWVGSVKFERVGMGFGSYKYHNTATNYNTISNIQLNINNDKNITHNNINNNITTNNTTNNNTNNNANNNPNNITNNTTNNDINNNPNNNSNNNSNNNTNNNPNNNANNNTKNYNNNTNNNPNNNAYNNTKNYYFFAINTTTNKHNIANNTDNNIKNYHNRNDDNIFFFNNDNAFNNP